MWKLFSEMLAEKIYDHLDSARKGSGGTKDELIINKLAIAWIDYRKAYSMVPYS